MRSISDSDDSVRSGFQRIADVFLAQPGLPFARVLSAERIERVFAKHGNLFGLGTIYSTSMMVWAFLGQVLRDGKGASCQAAVAKVVAYQQLTKGPVPTADTGDYCRARAKLSEHALRDLATEVAGENEQQAHPNWLWKGRHAGLVDGFTFTMPDTPKNQKEYPQPPQQRPGVGFPIARAGAIISLATACLRDLALGPFEGKQTGETALLRTLLESFAAGDIMVADRYFCSFMMIALFHLRKVDCCVRMHQSRHVDFRRGRRVGKTDHIITWTKPQRPEWMDEATYAAMQATLEFREIRFQIVEPGQRTQTLTIVTTLLDEQEYTKADIAAMYGFRWNAELDIRAIKQSLNLNHVRCKSPEMVRRELWTTILSYNLIRTTAAAAAMLHDKQPRQISFTSTCQYVLSTWGVFSSGLVSAQDMEIQCRGMLQQIASCEVADRPGRIEPRVIKRRRHRYKLMQEPRKVLREKLKNDN